MPNPGAFIPVFDPSKKGKPKPWYVGIPKRLTKSGKYGREYFATEDLALQRSAQLVALEKSSERIVREAGPDLIKTAVNYEELFRGLYGLEGGLAQACEAYMAILDEEQRHASFGQLLDTFEKDSFRDWAAGTRSAWKSFRNHVKPLENRPSASLNTDFWRDWLDQKAAEQDWSGQTCNDIRSRLSSVYKHSMPDLVRINPLDGLKRRKVRPKVKAVYSLEQIQALLNCAWQHDRELVPYFSIAIFAGLRPESELLKLQWEDVNFAAGWIRVASQFDNKTSAKRFVPILGNLALWLSPWRTAVGSIIPSNFVKRRRWVTRGKYQAPEGSKEEQWTELVPHGPEVRDITRHTFGSYMDAATGHDRNKIREWMGHSNFKTYEQHYRNARPEEDGKLFLGIRPPGAMDSNPRTVGPT